jgi:hypothetical protein
MPFGSDNLFDKNTKRMLKYKQIDGFRQIKFSSAQQVPQQKLIVLLLWEIAWSG